jgi:tRNA uridine 5-carbamoylmethylation protein Kti12
MSLLSLKKPMIIMTIGLPGAGKTFFARQFADTFKVPIVSYNAIYNLAYGQQVLDDDKYEVCSRAFQHIYAELLKTGSTIVLDGFCDTFAMRQQLMLKTKNLGYDYLVVWVQTDDQTALRRSLRSNKREPEQHLPQLNEEQFTILADQLEVPKKEDNVVISGKHTFTTQARMVLRKIAAARASQADMAYRENARQPRPGSSVSGVR